MNDISKMLRATDLNDLLSAMKSKHTEIYDFRGYYIDKVRIYNMTLKTILEELQDSGFFIKILL